MLRVRLLGGIDITRDTLPFELPARQKAVALLVMLLTAPEGRLERRHAATALFAESPPDRALANLRLQVFHLQQALAAGGAAEWLDAGRDALAWRRNGATWIDVDAFNDAAGRLRDARVDGVDAADVDAARRALALYRGELAPGVYLPAIDAARDALAARHRAVSLWLGQHLATHGAWHEALRIAAALVDDDPLDDEAQQLLVRVLLGRGDPAAAAAAIKGYAAQLDPHGEASEVVAWGAAVLAGDRRDAGRPTDAVLPEQRVAPKAVVQAPRSTLVGRANERRALAEMLRGHAIVTLIGPGGTGKTRLATEVAAARSAALADHAWFVDLGAVERPGQVLAQVALALGVGHVPGQAPDNGIRTRLHGLRGLVVLDNCEHVIESAAAAARLVVGSGEGIRVLATSRRPLGLDGEIVWRLGPLSLPPEPGRGTATWHDLETYDAPQLFVIRAGLVRDEATATDQAAAVVSICRQLDGLPLAIELVAAQCRVLSLGELAADINLLAHSVDDGQRWRPSRHRTLRSTIAWSYNLLEPDERALLRRLAVFSGGFTRAAAAAVVGAGGGAGRGAAGAAVRTMLPRLVDRSLLAMSPDAGTTPRFHLLHTIRHFAARQLEQDDRADRWQRRHALYFERIAVQAEGAFLGRDEALWLARLRLDHTNLVAAIQWSAANGQPELAMRIAAHLWRHWYGAGHVPQATAMLTALADDLPLTAPAHLRHMALFALGQLAFAQGSYDRADEALRAAVAGFASEGDERHQALGLTFLCRTAINRADFDAAAEHGRTALALLTARDDPHAIAIVQLALADGSIRQMKLDEAVALYRACLGTWRALRYASGAASAHLGLGMVRLRQADYRRARAHFERSLALRHRAKEEIGVAAAEALIAAVDAAVGDLGAARVGFAASLERYRAHGNIAGVASCLHNLGDVAWRRGELEAADQHYEQALMLPYVSDPMRAWLSYARAEVRLAQGDAVGAAEHIGAARTLASAHALQDLVADTLRLEARLAFDRGDVAGAHRMLAESLGIWRGQGALEGALRALDTWLACAPAEVSPAAAIELQAAIDHWRERKACPRASVEQRGVDARIAAALAVVGPHVAAEARSRGRRWPMEALWEVSDRVGAADDRDGGPRQHGHGGHD